MNFPLLRLEIRKNGLSAASAAAAFLITLPVSLLVSSATGLEPRLSLDAGLTAWVLLGVPLAAVLIGASSGSATGSADAVAAEGLLPRSPERRALNTLAASVFLAAAFAAFVLATAAVLGMPPGRVLSPGQKAWGASFWYGLELAPLVALAALDALAGAWALSRLLGHGVAGGLLALVATAATAAGIAVSFGLQVEHHDWGVAGTGTALLIAWGGAAAKFWAGALAARWSERRTGPRALAGVLVLMLLPAIAIWGRSVGEMRMLDARVVPATYEAIYSYQSFHDPFPHGAKALAAAGTGAVLKTVRGGVVIASASGVRPLVAEQNTGLSELLLEPYKTWLHGAWRDDMGRLWIERYVSPNTELWRVDGGKAESRRVTDGGSLSMILGEPLKHRYPDGKRMLVARAEDYFERGDKARWYEGYNPFLDARRRETGAAKPACGGRCLDAGGRRWTLPGQAIDDGFVSPDEFAGRRAYLIPVRKKDGRSVVALCRADGTVDIAWPYLKGFGYGGLPDGTLYSADGAVLHGIGPDGKLAAPIPYGALAATLPARRDVRPQVVRLSGSRAWLIWGGRLTVLDAAGRKILSRELGRDLKEVVPLADGFLFTTARSAYFSDWEGNTRLVENPR